MSGLSSGSGFSVGSGLSGSSGLARGGGLTPGAQRSFFIFPAVNGKTLWNLVTDGPCTLVRANSPYTMRASLAFSGDVEVWGGSGGSGGVGNTTVTSGANATPASAFFGGGITSIVGNSSVGRPGVIVNGNTAGGAGATATGGDTNTTGTAGGAGSTSVSSTCTGGTGGGTGGPSPGVGGVPVAAPAGTNQAGVSGTAPGGGAAGAAHGDATNGNRRATGGTGGGGYSKKTYTTGQLGVVAHSAQIGGGGAAGTGDLANGAAGNDGKVLIT